MSHSYFDHNATTPVCQEVLDAMLPALLEVYGNPSSIHTGGQAARHRLDVSRREVASLLGCGEKEIVFTSGGTEADNLAIFGIGRRKRRRHIVTTAIEHPAVLSACAQLEREDLRVTYVRPDARGVVDPDDIDRALTPDTALISVMHVNNETGAIQPVEEIGAIARAAGVFFHVDGVQAAGRIPIDVSAIEADLYSISSHKMYAPKGTGALFVRKGTSLAPLLHGGRHENGRRAGTENVPGAIAMGVACRAAQQDLTNDEPGRLQQLRDRFEQQVLASVEDVKINALQAPRAPHVTNLCFHGIEGEAMVIALDLKGFAVSSGSACSSGAIEPSHVLTAMGLTKAEAKSSIRISLGRSNTPEQVDALAGAIVECVTHLRRLSTAYV